MKTIILCLLACCLSLALSAGAEGDSYLEDFGAKSVPGHDNADAIERAWNEGAHVRIRAGIYEYGRPLRLWNRMRVRWEGLGGRNPANPDGENTGGAVFRYTGSERSADYIWLNRVNHCTFENIQFDFRVQPVKKGEEVFAGLYIDNDHGLQGARKESNFNTTELHFLNCEFSFSMGTPKTEPSSRLIRIGTKTASHSYNNDMHVFRDCMIGSRQSKPYVLIQIDGSNTHAILFDRCELLYSRAAIQMRSQPFCWFNNCTVLGHEIMLELMGGMAGPVVFRDCNEEWVRQLVKREYSNGWQHVSIIGGRWAPPAVVKDVPWIDWASAGTISFRDAYFGHSLAAGGPEVNFRFAGENKHGRTLIVDGCVFPNTKPFASSEFSDPGTEDNGTRLYWRGNSFIDDVGAQRPLAHPNDKDWD